MIFWHTSMHTSIHDNQCIYHGRFIMCSTLYIDTCIVFFKYLAMCVWFCISSWYSSSTHKGSLAIHSCRGWLPWKWSSSLIHGQYLVSWFTALGNLYFCLFLSPDTAAATSPPLLTLCNEEHGGVRAVIDHHLPWFAPLFTIIDPNIHYHQSSITIMNQCITH